MARTGPFDEHYEEYEQWFSDNRYVYRSELSAVGHLVPSCGEGIEVGIGSGAFIIGLVDRDSLLGKTYERHKNENVFYREATFYSSEEVLSLLKNEGFRRLEAIQTVFGQLSGIRTIQRFKRGYGEGGFVVIRAIKP